MEAERISASAANAAFSESAGFFSGAAKVSLEEVLEFRERKKNRQQRLLAEFAHPLLCLGLNIPGEYKRFFLADASFREQLRIVRLALAAEGIQPVHEETFESSGGCAAFISAAAPPEKLKEIARRIEDTHSLGRLFDIDVLKTDGGKISRRDSGEKARPCLVCGGDAFVCGRSRAHGAEEPANAAAAMMLDFRREQLAGLVARTATRALMAETAVTPKPGLVDRANTGAHRDMDFFSFIDSAAALVPFFEKCARAGFDFAAGPPEKAMSLPTLDARHPSALFRALRIEGKMAELEMLSATRGANTHRGIIFSIGLAAAAFGAFFRHYGQIRAEDVLAYAACMACHVTDDFGGGEPSHGKLIHGRYGIGGVREEARQGFPALRDCALPVLGKALASGMNLNDAGLAAFLHLLASVADTNIIHRSSPETLAAIQKNTSELLAANPNPEAMKNYAEKLDREFIEKNISPGGCADLLALGFFLHWLTLPDKSDR